MAGNGTGPLWAVLGGAAAVLAGRAIWRGLTAYNLHGKKALVTGGSRGLGLEIARRLADEGARVAVCARDEEELARAADDFRGRGQELVTLPCDLTEKDQIDRMMTELLGRWGRIDVLVNNAGVIQTGPLEEMTLDDYEESMRIHFWASLYTINAVLPGMRVRREGRIVNIASIGGKVSVPHLVPYCASKFALVGLSQGLRAELAKDGIAVTTVCPGLMRTGSPRNAMFKGQHRAEHAWFSVSDSLPLVSVSSHYAARRIVNACKRGDAEIMISLPARVGATVHGVFPGLTADLLGLVNRLLPGPGGIGRKAVPGRESQSAWSPSWLTALTERAAARNNEMRS